MIDWTGLAGLDLVGAQDPAVWDGTVLAGNGGSYGQARRGQAGWATEGGYKLHGWEVDVFVRMHVSTFDESGL